MIKVYEPNEKLFNHNGIKILKPSKCYIFKEDNGDYYIELEDSIENIEYYQANMIVTCPTPFPEGNQAFRLLNPIKNLSKVVVKGKHVYFDRANYIVKDSYVVDKNCGYALDYLNNNADTPSPFKTSSNITTNNTCRIIRKSLLEADNEIITRWSGHLIRDNFNIAINSEIGEDRGVNLRYGKNISNIKIEENWDSVVTKILPVGKDGILLPEVYLQIEDSLYDIPFTKVVSFNQNINIEDYQSVEDYEQALIEDLRNQATYFLNDNKYPKVNYLLSAHLDKITDVGDKIYVEHPKLKVAILTRVISVKWDAILNKYKNIEFGNFKKSLKNLIQDINESSKKIATDISNETKYLLESELKNATSEIWQMMGNSHVIYDGDKILVVDALPKEDAVNVMMINSGGIGFSTTGINGVFNSAWTIDGTLNMQNVNVINLVADLIKGGTLKLGGTNNTNGAIEIYNEQNELIGKIDNTGVYFSASDVENELNELRDYTNDIDSKVNNIQTNLNNNYLTTEQVESELNTQKDDIELIKQQQTQWNQTATNLQANITEIMSNGTQNLKNTMVTIDIQGIKVATNLDKFSSLLNNKGLFLYGYGYEVARFTNEGTELDNLTVRNYLTAGYHRTEKYIDENGKKWTAQFWVGD